MKKVVCTNIKYFWTVITWTPLILTSIVFKIGMLNLSIKFFGWNAAYFIVGQVMLNILQLCLMRFLKCEKIKLKHQDTSMPEGNESSMANTIFIGYANLFVITRPFNSLSNLSMNKALIIQPAQALVNTILISFFIYWENNSLNHEIEHMLKPMTVLILGMFNILLCFIDFTCKIHIKSSKNTEGFELEKSHFREEIVYKPLNQDEELIPVEDMRFIALHSKVTLENIQASLSKIEQGMIDKRTFRELVLLCYPDIGNPNQFQKVNLNFGLF